MNQNQLAKIYGEVQELRIEERILLKRYHECEQAILTAALEGNFDLIPNLAEEMQSNKHRRRLIIGSVDFRWRKVKDSGHDVSEPAKAYWSIGQKTKVQVN